MTNPRRTAPLRPSIAPLVPDFSAAPITFTQADVDRKTNAVATAWKKLVNRAERTHQTTERALSRHITSLEAQVSDLRQLYFAAIKFEISTKEN
jgi:hypothetical protein